MNNDLIRRMLAAKTDEEKRAVLKELDEALGGIPNKLLEKLAQAERITKLEIAKKELRARIDALSADEVEGLIFAVLSEPGANTKMIVMGTREGVAEALVDLNGAFKNEINKFIKGKHKTEEKDNTVVDATDRFTTKH